MSKRSTLRAALLATSCLTAIATGSAGAAVYNESTVGDFPDSPFGTVLPAGFTGQIFGGFGEGDFGDFFSLSGYNPGDTVSVDFTKLNASPAASGGLDFGGNYCEGSVQPTPINVAITSSTSSLGLAACRRIETPEFNYRIDVSVAPANQVPVPATAALVGIAALGLGLRRRKHQG